MIVKKGQVLKECTDGHIRAIPGKKGFMTVQVTMDGKLRMLHSSYDPVREAQRLVAGFEWEDAELILLFGAGLGYVVKELMGAVPRYKKVVIVEPEEGMAALFAQQHPELIKEDRLFIVIAQDQKTLYQDLSFFIDREKLVGKVGVLAMPAYMDCYPLAYDAFALVHNTLYGKVASEMYSIIRSGAFWANNCRKSRQYLDEAAPIRRLFGQFRKKPAVIVSAGPSLSGNIHYLKQKRGQVLIISTDAAFKTLQAHDIVPHIIVSVSGQPGNANKLKDTSYGCVPLVFKPGVWHTIPKDHQGVKFLAPAMDLILLDFLDRYGIRAGVLESGGSVACSAFDMAVKMACSPIIFIGQDLAHTGDVSHVDGAVDFIAEKGNILAEDIYGKPITTTAKLRTFQQWFANRIKSIPADVAVINATQGGIGIPGVPNKKLHDVLDELTQWEDFDAQITKLAQKGVIVSDTQLAALTKIYQNADNRFSKSIKSIKEKLANGEEGYEQWVGLLIEHSGSEYFRVMAEIYRIGAKYGGPSAQFYQEVVETIIMGQIA